MSQYYKPLLDEDNDGSELFSDKARKKGKI